ncbi:MAG TPA: pyridoxal-dependent decarboxylase [Polyangiales bacterium]|nr:pyridoxal-dependent decarboxylase [Polyangiales bacterium]
MDYAEPFDSLLARTLQHALQYIAALPRTSVDATASLETLRSRLCTPLPAAPVDAVEVIDRLVADVRDGLTASTGGRFFAWVIGGTVPAALAADWLTSTWDQNAGMYRVSPAAAVVEEACGAWLLELFGLPRHCSFALVTGCQMAHVTCLAAARNALLARCGWDVEQRGLFGAPRLRVISSDQRHATVERALRLLGFGRDCVVDLPGPLTAAGLEHELQRSDAPAIVLLQAGDINTGAFDDFETLLPIARRHGAWAHVDGAFGLWAAVSPEHARLSRGVELADSWATDGHKWLNVPYDCGYAFVSDRDAHARAFGHKASYVTHSELARDQVDWNPEYSRRARGFATYAALKSLGRAGLADLVARCCRAARAIVAGAAQLPGVEVACEPVINQGLLRFRGADDADTDRRTEAVSAALAASGEALFACTTWNGKRCMRVSVSGWRTSDEDVRQTLQALARCLAQTA